MPGGKTRLWLRVDDNEIGQGYYVPIIVVKGAQPGPRFLLTAGIHGDELNGIGVIHQLVEGLDPATMKGNVIAMPASMRRACAIRRAPLPAATMVRARISTA